MDNFCFIFLEVFECIHWIHLQSTETALLHRIIYLIRWCIFFILVPAGALSYIYFYFQKTPKETQYELRQIKAVPPKWIITWPCGRLGRQISIPNKPFKSFKVNEPCTCMYLLILNLLRGLNLWPSLYSKRLKHSLPSSNQNVQIYISCLSLERTWSDERNVL